MTPMGTVTRTADGGYVLAYERRLDKSPSEVWAALTDPVILMRWLSRCEVDLRIGGEFIIHFFDGKETMSGVIRALETNRLIEYTWDEQGSPDSVVRWTIAPDGKSCRLTLTHTLPAGTTDAITTELGGGWHAILDNLARGFDGVMAVYDEAKVRGLEARYRELLMPAHGREGSLMTTSDGTRIIAFDRYIEQPVEKVWSALIDPVVLRNWIGDVEIEPRVGGKYEIRFRESMAVMPGTIVAFERERLLEYTWFEDFGAPPSSVRWEISPAGSGCRLRLRHSISPNAVAPDVIGYLGGWHDFLDSLPGAVEGKFMPYGNKPGEKEIDALYRARYPLTEPELAVTMRIPAVRFVRILPGPMEWVWQHLTDATLLPSWFGNATIEGRTGGKVWLMDGHVRGTVTQWHPPYRLAYTWNVFAPSEGDGAVSTYPESHLSFSLEASAGGVRLTLSHMPVLDRFEKQNAMGWHTFLDILGATLRGEKVEQRSFYSKKNAALYGVDLSNLVR
jgi:uncharacterized protein YndB with AHSA1/START domain